MTDLSGKTAIVTGASSGLGRHFAQVLAKHGAWVALGARRMGALDGVANEIKRAGGTAVAISLDVTQEDSVRAAVATTVQEFGGIDILVNNSGISIPKAPLEQTGAEWDDIMATNLKGAFLMATEVSRAMITAKRGGSIVNIASILGLRTAGHLTAYAASKAGLIHMTHSLAMELARYSIRVNAIAPGYFNTPMNEAVWETDAGKAMIKRIPQRRLGGLADLDGPLLLLASDASAYMTGSVITVDGGHVVSGV